MKALYIGLFMALFATRAAAIVRPVNVADSTISTVSGVGGSAEVTYSFAKGDKISLVASASKPMSQAMVLMPPQSVLVRAKDSRKVNQTFEMPQDGVVIIRFISDRGGVNHVHYSLVRLPASEAVQDYDTHAAQPSTTSTMAR